MELFKRFKDQLRAEYQKEFDAAIETHKREQGELFKKEFSSAVDLYKQQLMQDPVFKAAYAQAELHREKQKQYEQLEATRLNYAIIQDLVNSAQAGVEITLNLPDGTRMEIKPGPDAFDKAKHDRFGRFF